MREYVRHYYQVGRWAANVLQGPIIMLGHSLGGLIIKKVWCPRELFPSTPMLWGLNIQEHY
jgi:alpha-beta hydrolase superfamily lysophospholipase